MVPVVVPPWRLWRIILFFFISLFILISLGATATNELANHDSTKRKWESVLVKTGVWEPGYQTHGATIIKNNVMLGVECKEILA